MKINKKYFLLSKRRKKKNKQINKIFLFVRKKFKINRIFYIDKNNIDKINFYLEREIFEIKKIFVIDFDFCKKINKINFNLNKNNIFLFNNSFKFFIKKLKRVKILNKNIEKKHSFMLKKLFLKKKKNKNSITFYKLFFKKYIINYLYKKKKYDEIFKFLNEEIYILKKEIKIKFPYNNLWDYMIEKYITVKE
ncbi:hypothetical protein ONB66_00420 [Candidatus Vidania fulgoroideae]|uniref:Uncharacterized protein n=1 Tax=Candidatus Vidania fulgoroideorum TaxID=881286 RepID=A0AAX3N9H0_9PROT|nr:hypothetical protein ONB67_00470 [Candidatus Vidania fulgoroideae]WDR79477.1 hypothetical protein ONB66_00420 [Candidatus Vidania fulgoroideae]